jgi:mono/diheme cytochrome c family protein
MSRALVFLVLLACNRNQEPQRSETGKRGRALYQAHCSSCHALNPKVAGAIGPEVYGSSLELLKKRILEASYPEGYLPKRPTKIMQSLPHLKSELDAIFTYLNE